MATDAPPATATVATLAAAMANGETSSSAATQACLARIEALNPDLNCVITVTADLALAAAIASDQRRAQGRTLGPLDGVPMLHKDLFCTEGVATTCGSRMLAEFVAPYDATVVSRCREAGLVMLGKTNMDEFAMGSSNEHSHFGAVRNPWDRARVPGGSSGGSAAAVAARLVPLATGTDTGGSIRQPASFCGVTGLKPTYGRVSRYGMVAFASSLDQGGLLATSARDIAMTLPVIAGYDPRDSTAAECPVDDYAGTLDAGLQGLRIGLDPGHFETGLDPAVAAAVRGAGQALEALGAELVEIELTESALSVPTYYVIALAECSSNLSRYDGVRFGHRSARADSLEEMYEHTRAEGFGAEVKRRIMLGTYALSAGYYDAYYRKAQQLRRLIAEDYQRAFAAVDLILSPASPTPAFRLGERLDDPVTMYLSDVYTCGVNLAGLPAACMPVGMADGLPIGAQLIANHWQEATLLRTAHAFQSHSDWHLRQPQLGAGAECDG